MGRGARWVAVLGMLVACSASTHRALDAGHDAQGVDAAGDAAVDAGVDAASDASDSVDAGFDDGGDQAIRPDRMYVFLECPIRLLPANLTLRRNYNYDCVRSADCTELPNGVCFGVERTGELYDSYCRYLGCVGDSDCAANEACECGGGWSGFRRCITVECHTDSDCEPGHQCLSWPECYEDVIGKSCTTANDLCRTHQDCQDMGAGDICVDTGPRRTCAPANCQE